MSTVSGHSFHSALSQGLPQRRTVVIDLSDPVAPIVVGQQRFTISSIQVKAGATSPSTPVHLRELTEEQLEQLSTLCEQLVQGIAHSQITTIQLLFTRPTSSPSPLHYIGATILTKSGREEVPIEEKKYEQESWKRLQKLLRKASYTFDAMIATLPKIPLSARENGFG